MLSLVTSNGQARSSISVLELPSQVYSRRHLLPFYYIKMPESGSQYVPLDGSGRQSWMSAMMQDSTHRKKVIIFALVAIVAVGIVGISIYYVKHHKTPDHTTTTVAPTTVSPTTTTPATTTSTTTVPPTTTTPATTTSTTTEPPSTTSSTTAKPKSSTSTTAEPTSSTTNPPVSTTTKHSTKKRHYRARQTTIVEDTTDGSDHVKTVSTPSTTNSTGVFY